MQGPRRQPERRGVLVRDRDGPVKAVFGRRLKGNLAREARRESAGVDMKATDRGLLVQPAGEADVPEQHESLAVQRELELPDGDLFEVDGEGRAGPVRLARGGRPGGRRSQLDIDGRRPERCDGQAEGEQPGFQPQFQFRRAQLQAFEVRGHRLQAQALAEAAGQGLDPQPARDGGLGPAEDPARPGFRVQGPASAACGQQRGRQAGEERQQQDASEPHSSGDPMDR